jgi:hypothetical protein
LLLPAKAIGSSATPAAETMSTEDAMILGSEWAKT